LRDVGYQSAWIIGAVCPARDIGVSLVTRFGTAAMNLFLAELAQAAAPGAHGIVLMDEAGGIPPVISSCPKTSAWCPCRPIRPNSTRSSGYSCISKTIATRSAFSRPRAMSSTPVVTRGIGWSAKPDAFDPCVPIPGSNGSAINQVSIIARDYS
jgi:hypothetical protein